MQLITSFERAETNHDKVASPKQHYSPMRCQFPLRIFVLAFKLCFFADNFRECTILNAVHEEIFKL